MSELPFSAVVGQDQAKLALMLAAVEPRLGGVLLRGDKGSAKTTLARGLASLLADGAPFAELPLGATEERLIGSLDLAELLTNGQPRFRAGLLAAADGGVLYVDEINLLADHLVDVLLDVAVSGVNRVEREGLSHTHPARFILVGSMNPEEGELRPQLLDRFGLAVDVAAPADIDERRLAVRRQLDAERGATGVNYEADQFDLRSRLAAAQTTGVAITDDLMATTSRLAVAVGVDGLRGDLMLCRAATANAAIEGRSMVEPDDVRRVAEMVLGHRCRRRPFDEPGITPDKLDDAWDDAIRPERDGETGPGEGPLDDDAPAGDGSHPDQIDAPGAATRTALPDSSARVGRRSSTAPHGSGSTSPASQRGRFVREEPFDGHAIDARSTAIAVARRRAERGPEAAVDASDLRGARHEQQRGSLAVFVVDASGSMGVEHRMAGTKAAVMGLLEDAYRRRSRVALVTFRHDDAEVVLRPTASVEIARARLADLPTGGKTPLAAGLDAATRLVSGSLGDPDLDHHVIVVTDGRATSGPGDPVEASREAAGRLVRAGAQVLILDSETGATRLGLAAQLAEQIGARCLRLDELENGLEPLVRAELARARS